MELVTAGGSRRKVLARQDAVSQLRDVGDRLDYVLGRYSRLVCEVADGTVPVPDFSGRVALLNSQMVFVAERLQELLVLQHEAARSLVTAVGDTELGRRRAYPRSMVRALA
jgi:hypothetical protein